MSWALRDEESFERRERDRGRALRTASRDLWGVENRLQPSVQRPQGGSRWGLAWRQALQFHLWVWMDP